MFRQVLWKILLAVVLIAMVISGMLAMRYYARLPQQLSQHETLVLGQNKFVPGSQAGVRVLVRDTSNGAPLSEAAIKVSMRPAAGGKDVLLFEGKTNAQGSADVSFKVPDSTETAQTLVVETRSTLGSDVLEQGVTLARDYRVLLTTDKPIYQPGQLIHMRALALSAFDLTPAADQALTLTVADGKGNKVFRQELTTSEYGVASADFQLASEVNSGAYKINAVLGNTSSEKTVSVEYYVLPKFNVDLQTEQAYYLPGQHVRGTLKAGYFFGKPVSGGKIVMEGFTFDVERTVTVSIQGNTTEDGSFEFEFDLPQYVAGSEFEGGLGRYYLQASVTDQAQHTEMSNLSLPVAGSALVIEAIPESGVFRPNVENILYVMVSYPDGSPANTDLSINFSDTGKTVTASSGEYGLAEVRCTPNNSYVEIDIQASDALGNTSNRHFTVNGEWFEDSLLLRPERAVYRVGDTMKLDFFTAQPRGTVYLDIVREGQTVSTRSLAVENGRAAAAIDLTPDLYGTLELHAYKVMPSGSITRDTRLVVVNNVDDLIVNLKPALDTYRPGDTANLDIQVNGMDGSGAQSILGLAIVDESVFALAEQDPGFAKLYFLLETEIMTPRFDLHGFSVPRLVSEGGIPTNDEKLRDAVNTTAKAALSAAVLEISAPYSSVFSMQGNSHYQALDRSYKLQSKFYTGFTNIAFGFFLALAAGLLGVTIAGLVKTKRFVRSLLLSLVLLAVLALVITLWSGEGSFGYRVGNFLNTIMYRSELIIGILALASIVSLVFLTIHAIVKKDGWLGWQLLLLLLLISTLILLVLAAQSSNINPRPWVFVLVIVAFLVVPITTLLRFSGFVFTKRIAAAVFSAPLALFMLVGLMPVISLSSMGGAMAPMGEVMLRGDGVMALGNGMVVEKAVEMAPAPTQAPASGGRDTDTSATKATGSAAEPPRLRQYFPETMLWLPDAVTDENGTLQLQIPVADSITTWRMTALASTRDGRLGSTTGALRVFQDFFIDLDLPLSLTVGDEVAIPVGVFNYLPEAQTVRLELDQPGWFELMDEPVKEMQINANEISVVYFRIKASQFGSQPFKVTAYGSKMSDAIQKEVRVYPNGKRIDLSQSDRLASGQPVSQTISIPADAIPGTPGLLVKIYPGILSQVVEGLDSILRMPNGCFEQTSSSTYPNVLVLDYLRSTQQVAPEAELKAEEYINLGYQRLTTFEVQSSGGFSLFGDEPADRMLTAYGLQEFSDMSRVHDVDPALMERAARWLLSQQADDGSWENDRGLVHESTWSSLGNDRLPVTAYIAWSLVEAGYIDDAGTQKGLDYVREFQAQAEDPYVLALVANALVSADLANSPAGERKLDSSTLSVLDRLAGMAQRSGSAAFWPSGVATFMGSEGQTGSIETTALAALALLRADNNPEIANGALTFLVQQKDSFGTWYSTQATVLTLKALLQSVRSGAENIDATVTLSLNDGQQQTIQVNPGNFDVVQMVRFDDISAGQDYTLKINAEGKGNLMYQVATSYYLPWEKLALYPEISPAQDLVTIDVSYDRNELAVNDTVTVSVTISLNEVGGKAESALIDLGLPPGFTLMTEDLAVLVNQYNDTAPDYPSAKIERFEMTGRQVLVYLTNLSQGQPLTFSYRLRARFPLSVQAPASSVYDYYNPDVNGEQAPEILVVE